ncbi:MAG: histidine kinase [Eubacteriales bacterium]|nr:histidine kinase [Eubacteriales bacterium]
MRKGRNRTLKKEITILMLVASACTLLSACVAVFYVVFVFFTEKAQSDIEYVLENTNQQFQDHMQFIEDGAVSIRHNTVLDAFFEQEEYDRTAMELQLSYSMELFSDRNMQNRQIPFVTSVYLFNNADDCLYEHYYASTLAAETEQARYYTGLQQEFKESGVQYECRTHERSISLLFRIYDDEMREKGVCIAEINREAIALALEGITSYSQSAWVVLGGQEEVLAFYGEEDTVLRLTETQTAWSGWRTLDGMRLLGCADTAGFGVRTVLAVGRGNIFALLKPTLMIFGVGLLIVLAVTVTVAYGTSYRFTKPVTRMIESIRAFGNEDFDVRMEDSSIQEFHDIGMVFNEMADRIRYLITQVYEKQLLATQSQVKYLQSQINPHFQFNILAMLSLKAKMAGNEEVYEGLRAFSKLTQGRIFREKEIKIKVSEELEIVSFYLYLQKSRYQEKLSYEISLENEDIREDLIPRLLIEPLVENAVSHGLEPKKENGTIRVHLREEKREMLHICVEDDGVGFDTDKLAESGEEPAARSAKADHTQTGLENTRRMLHILYGENHEFHIRGGRGQGTRIEIVIPVERGGDYVESHGGR